MTYFGFLSIFLGIPLLVLSALRFRDVRSGRELPPSLQPMPLSLIIAAHVIIALVYTTPWDNYLVATGVWWYDPKLVTGIVLGWVPIEEYTFFVLQTVAAGLLLAVLAVRLSTVRSEDSNWASARLRIATSVVLGCVWLGALSIFLFQWQPGTYLALELAWAIPPIVLQMAFGADILWRYRKLVFWTLVPATLYLSAADALAIQSGTWTIDPAQSTGIMLGPLPIEEAVFFLATSTLVVFGMTLMLAEESQARAPQLVTKFLRRLRPSTETSEVPNTIQL